MFRNFILTLALALVAASASGDSSWTGGSGGGGTISHATDCPNSGTVAAPGTICIDQDDGKVWTCKAAPAAGTDPAQCDISGDWLLGSSSSASGVSTFNSRSGVVVPATGDYTATQVTSTATGDVAATNAQTAIAELASEKATAAALTTLSTSLSTSGTINNGGNPVDWTKLKNVPAGLADGTDDGGAGGGGDVTAASPFGTDNLLVRSDGTGKGVQASGVSISDGNEVTTPGGLTTGTGATAGKVIFGEGTAPSAAAANTIQLQAPSDITTAYDLIFPQLSRTGVLFGNNATNVNNLDFLAYGISTDAPSVNNDLTEGYGVGSFWVETTSSPDRVYVCTDASNGVAVWQELTNTSVIVPTMQQTADQGRSVLNAVSLPSAIVLGEDNGDGDCTDSGEGCLKIYNDSATGFHMDILPLGHRYIDVPATFAQIWRYDGTEAMRLDATTLKFAGAWRPFNSVEVAGKEFGTCTFGTAIVAASKPKVDTFTCADSDSDGVDWDFRAPTNWDGGQIKVQLSVFSVNAAPASNVVFTCSAQAVSDGDVIANKVTTGEAAVSMTLATQYKEETATSALFTVNGSPVAGDHIYGHCDVDATLNTVNANMADVRLNAMVKVFYTVTQITE